MIRLRFLRVDLRFLFFLRRVDTAAGDAAPSHISSWIILDTMFDTEGVVSIIAHAHERTI